MLRKHLQPLGEQQHASHDRQSHSYKHHFFSFNTYYQIFLFLAKCVKNNVYGSFWLRILDDSQHSLQQQQPIKHIEPTRNDPTINTTFHIDTNTNQRGTVKVTHKVPNTIHPFPQKQEHNTNSNQNEANKPNNTHAIQHTKKIMKKNPCGCFWIFHVVEFY